MPPTIPVIVTRLREINRNAVANYYNDERGYIVIDTDPLDTDDKNAVHDLLETTPEWHLDDRPRKNNTWRAKPH